ncbi:MAG: histidine kinase [Lutibacter sp.]|nr:MAG: histidine kinase [Lutibacter sp.]
MKEAIHSYFLTSNGSKYKITIPPKNILFYFVLFIACLNPNFLLAQTSQSNNEILLESLQNWIEEHIEIPKDSIEVLDKAHKLRGLSHDIDNVQWQAKSYSNIAKYYMRYTPLDSTLHYLHLAKDIYTDTDTENELELAKTYLELKAYYNLKAAYSKSMENVYAALEIYEKNDNQQGIALCFTHLCDLLYYQNDYVGGISYCDKAIAIQEQLNFQKDLATSYFYKACNQLFSGDDLVNALITINKSMDLNKKIEAVGKPLLASRNTKGNILKYMNRYDEAIATYQKNYEESKRLKYDRYLSSSIANIGHVYVLQGKYQEALPYNLKAIDIIIKTGKTRNLWENYMHVSNSYEEIGDYKKALEYHHLYAEEYDQFQETMVQRLESEIQVKYETGKKNATIYFQDVKITKQNKEKTLYISIASLLTISLLGMYFTIKNIRKKRKELQLLNTELDVKNKQNVLLLKEIHHRVKNNLEMVKSLIALQSAQLDDEASKEAMLASQNRVQSMGIIHQKLYQGDNLGSIEMKDYFINLGEGILDTFNADDKVKIECAMDNLELDVDTAVPIGLIVNELLTNALKYAFPEDQKGNIEICLAQDTPEILTLKVVDNGIGKIKGQAPKGTGFGTQLIQLLTQQLNGKMTEIIKEGTSIFFQFKLNSTI